MPGKAIRNHKGSMTKGKGGQKPRNPRLTWLLVGLVVLAAELAAILFTRPHTSQPVEVAPPQAFAMFQHGALILDVRSQAEWDQFHIEGSLLIPLEQVQARLSELPRDVDILVVCLSGHRSASGVTMLRQAGYTRAVSLTGGLQAWQAAGYPMVMISP